MHNRGVVNGSKSSISLQRSMHQTTLQRFISALVHIYISLGGGVYYGTSVAEKDPRGNRLIIFSGIRCRYVKWIWPVPTPVPWKAPSLLQRQADDYI